MKKLRGWLAFATIAVACTAAHPALALDKIIVGYTAVSGNVPDFIAQDQGFFKAHGLDVEIQIVRGGNVLVPSLVANSMQIGALTTATMIQAADGGIDVVAVTNMSTFQLGMKESAVIVRKGAGIKTPADLKGKRVGTSTVGGVSEVMFDKWLLLKGVNLKDVTMVEIPYAEMPDVIKAGNLDAVLIPDPFLSAIVAAGTGDVLSYYIGEFADNVSSIVNSSTRAWADAHPKEVAAFRAAIEEAVAFAKANPDKTRAIIGKTLNLKPEVMATTSLPPVSAKITPADIKWWLDTMGEQGRLRSKLDAGHLIAP
jgi:NitT/TauT family transport system substrate-binding protein